MAKRDGAQAAGASVDPHEIGARVLLFVTGVQLDALDDLLSEPLLAGIIVEGALPREGPQRLKETARRLGVAGFIGVAGEDVPPRGFDGYLLEPSAVADTRAVVGDGVILIARCAVSRHAAFEAGEAGADVMLFAAPANTDDAALLDALAWWHDLANLPSCARLRPGLDAAAVLAAGADFLGSDLSELSAALEAIRARSG